MISGGNTTIHVSRMDAAVRFYTEVLGLKLTNLIGGRWATVATGLSYWTTEEVGAGLHLAFQPAQAGGPAPGTKGTVMFGLETYDPIEKVLEWLRERGVRIASDIIRFEAGNVVAIEDFDGNPTYVHEFPPEMLEEADRLDQARQPKTSEPRISGGHALVLVSNMDRAVQFYRDVLGLNLTYRFDDKFATLEAGRKLVVALHPTSSKYPAPGTRGSVVLALQTDEPIERVVSYLAARGVRIGGGKAQPKSSSVELEDTEGNTIVLTESGSQTAEEQPVSAEARKG